MYKAKYMKARDRYYENSTKNEELKNELNHVIQDVRELKAEIKMLIHTILGAAPELEPSFSSEELAEDEALDPDVQELQYPFSHREEGLKSGRGEGKEDGDRAYYSQQTDDYVHDISSRSVTVKDSSPHFRHRSRPISINSFNSSVQRSGGEPNGRFNQVSRHEYEDDNAFDKDGPNLRDYGDDTANSSYGTSFRKEQDHGLYYEDHSRPSPSSRHRSSQRGGETSGYHPYQHSTRQIESRYRSNGNTQLRSSADVEHSISPDERYSNNYASRSYRN